MFYGFGSISYNNARNIASYTAWAARDLRAGDMKAFKGDFVQVMAHTWFWLLLPALINRAIYQKPAKDEGAGKQAWNALGSTVTSFFPIARDVGYFVFNGGNGISAPFASTIQTMAFSADDLYKWLKDDRKHKPSSAALKHGITAAGMAVGFPGAAQIGKSVEFLWDLHNRDQKADDFWSFQQGIRTGESHPKK